MTNYCRDCAFFLNPEPSGIYADVIVTYDCPHAPHKWTGRDGYTTAGSEACSEFELAQFSQMQLF